MNRPSFPPVVLGHDEAQRRALVFARQEPDDRPAEVAALVAVVILLGVLVRLLIG